MLGERLIKANQIANKVFKNYHNEECIKLQEDINKVKGVYRKTKVVCSCWMCRNRRKDEGLTIHEKRQLEVEDEDLRFE